MSGIQWGRVNPRDVTENIIIIASGSSLVGFDFRKLKGLGYIITVNGSGNSVPFADAWFTLDPWGLQGPQLPKNFDGRYFAAVPENYGTNKSEIAEHRTVPREDITYLHRLRQHNFTHMSSETAYKSGLSEDTSCINTGNSGYGALNLAYHFRPKKILLLGIDGGIGYHYSTTETNRKLTYLPQMFKSAKPQLDSAGIQVINGSKNSSITAYDRMSIDDAIKEFIK